MIGVIADDFTGAAEIGAMGHRHGLRAEVVVGGEPSGNADLVCLETDSRSCTAEEAGRRAAGAAQRLVVAKAKWIYKKTDSVLRGQVVAELAAVLRELQQTRALLVPVNPALGRVLQGGHYFVGGKRICETEFARDPEHPRTSSSVLDLLGGGEAPVCVCRARDALPESGIVVGEAATAADLAEWATHRNEHTLAAGGAEFFGALLAATGLTPEPIEPAGPKSRQPAASGDGTAGGAGYLFVCGSASEATRQFVFRCRQAGVPVFSLPAKLAKGGVLEESELDSMAREPARALDTDGRAILWVGLPAVTDRGIARGLAVELVRLAARVLRRATVDRVYAEGGATAVALARRMDWLRLEVRQEISLGVVALGVEGGRALIVKPGSYAWPPGVLPNG